MNNGKIIGGIVGTLVLVGVLKGMGDAEMEEGFSIVELASAIIDGIADLTIYLIPTIIEAIGNLTGTA